MASSCPNEQFFGGNGNDISHMSLTEPDYVVPYLSLTGDSKYPGASGPFTVINSGISIRPKYVMQALKGVSSIGGA